MLEIDKVSKRYGAQWLARDLSLQILPGEILALLGPSGCGKSTLLNIIAGLEAPERGTVRFQGEDLACVPPEARHFALMFQDFALFPHLSVCENVCFGLVERRVPRVERLARATAILATVGLAGYEQRSVGRLSGGEAQRVALARALITEPRLLLLDEPFSSLDAHLRLALQGEFRQRINSLGMSALLVTHDRQEAFAMADRVALLHQGRIVQCAAPADLLAAPASAWVARFIGFDNVTEQWALPQSALRLGAGLAPASIEALQPLAEGVRVRVRQQGQCYVVQLSAREVAGLGVALHVGGEVGLAIDDAARIRFAPAPQQDDETHIS